MRHYRIGKCNTNILHLDCRQAIFCFQNFMINWVNLIKIRQAGGNTLNQETPDQIRRAGISTVLDRVDCNTSVVASCNKYASHWGS